MGIKEGVIAGALAGIVGGIAGTIVVSALALVGLYGIKEPIPMELLPSPVILFSFMIMVGIVFGVVFGVIYAVLYSSIPGKGISKGLCFGFFLWIIKDVAGPVYMLGYQANFMAMNFVVVGIGILVVYGFVLGAIYERLKKE